MFEVRTKSPMDDRWGERDEEIYAAAGRHSNFSGAGAGCNIGAGRDHGFEVATFAEAQAMKAALEQVEGVIVTIREK